MNKILMLIAALAFALFGLAAPANATDTQPSADNKPVTFCHYAGSNDHGGSGKYVKITTNVAAFYNAGHIDHVNDIWEAFSYVTKGGDTVNVPAQGDTALLAFDDCDQPDEDVPVTKPEVVFNDLCGTENDTFSVAPGEGYTVGAVQHAAGTQSITVTLTEGHIWADLTKNAVTFDRPEFTNVDCGLPETGAAEYATLAGWLSLSGAAVLGSLLLIRRRTV